MQTEDNRVLYLVYSDGSINSDIELEEDDLNIAIKWAIENDCHYIERCIWHSREDYSNYKPADEIKCVWKG